MIAQNDISLDKKVTLKNLLELHNTENVVIEYSSDKSQCYIIYDGKAWEFHGLREGLRRSENFIVTDYEVVTEYGSIPIIFFNISNVCHRHVWITYGIQKGYCKYCNIEGRFDISSGDFLPIN